MRRSAVTTRHGAPHTCGKTRWLKVMLQQHKRCAVQAPDGVEDCRINKKDPCHETSPAVRFAPPLCETTVGDGRTPRFHCGKAPSGLCEEEEKQQQQESRGVERESPHARGAGMIAAPAPLEGSSSSTRGCSRRATAEITADTITPSPPLAQPLQSPRRRR
ncbi:unnamed protein product [Lampetra planeri]